MMMHRKDTNVPDTISRSYDEFLELSNLLMSRCDSQAHSHITIACRHNRREEFLPSGHVMLKRPSKRQMMVQRIDDVKSVL